MESYYSRLVQTSDPSRFDSDRTNEAGETRELDYEQLGVAEVKTLVTVASRRPATGDSLHVVCRFKSVTIEAQNALLKVLEDTPVTTCITLVAPPDCQLLPTVLSRLQVTELASADSTLTFSDFRNSPLAERLQVIERKLKAKDTDWVRELKRELARALRAGEVSITPEIEFVERWLLVRGASNKMLLEQLALNLPAGTVPSMRKR